MFGAPKDTTESIQLGLSLTQEERQEMQRLNKRYGNRPKMLMRGYKQLCAAIIRRKEIERLVSELEDQDVS